MALTADPIHRLTRAYIGAGVYQGLLFGFVLVHNLMGVLKDAGYAPRLQMWLMLGAIVLAGTLGTYYRWRFGRVEPARPSLSRQVARGAVFALLVMMVVVAIVVVARNSDAKPIESIWLVLSAGTAMSLSNSRGELRGWIVPILASAGLLATLVVPALQPYRALGHGAMAAALVVTAVQLHVFLVRGFRHAHV